jgi:hypothetical protein
MTNNLPEPDDAPWLNLTQEEINQLRYNKQNLTNYGRERIRKLMEEKKLLKECRQTGRTTATTEKVLKTVFSQMTDKKTLECEIEEYALGIEQKAKEIGKLKDILDRKEQQLKQMDEEETLALIKKWSPLLDKEQSPNVKAMLIESQETKVKETDKVLIEGDTATINGIKYKRVEEPKPKHLQQIIQECFDDKKNVDTIPDIIDRIEKEWTPLNLNQKENRGFTDGYSMGFDDALNLVRKTLR